MTKREYLISKLWWYEGGTGLGICAVAALDILSEPPQSKEIDWPSTVAIMGDPADYTDEELEKLVNFVAEHDADYDRMFRYRKGCNMIFIRKEQGQWFRKRLTWESGPMWSSDLDDALATFRS